MNMSLVVLILILLTLAITITSGIYVLKKRSKTKVYGKDTEIDTKK